MEKLKKPYTAPAAELLLLAPAEALATWGISQNDQFAMNQWGHKVINSASIQGGNTLYQFRENGKITTK